MQEKKITTPKQKHMNILLQGYYFIVIFDGDFYLNFDNELYLKNKYVLNWKHDGIQFKTKRIAESIYLTNFNYNNDFYQVLQGYDISLNSCYSKQAIKLIKKFVPKAKLKIVK